MNFARLGLRHLLAAAALFAVSSFSSHATVTTGSLKVARGLHQANTLLDGRILVSGGVPKIDGAAVNSSEIYDPVTGTFTTVGTMFDYRSEHAAVTLKDGRVFAVGGYSATYPSLVIPWYAEIFDPATGQWRGAGTPQEQRARAMAQLLPNGKVFIMSKANNSNTNTSFSAEVYDPQSSTFTRTGSFVKFTEWHGMLALADGRVLKMGGSVYGTATNSAEIWNPATNQWTATGSMLAARQNFIPVLLADGKVLVAGGKNGFNLNTAEIYDPATGQFSATGSMPEYTDIGSATLLGNGNVVLTSRTSNGMLHYQTSTGLWNTTGAMPEVARDKSVSLLPNGNLLLAGGIYLDSTRGAYVWDQTCAAQRITLLNATENLGSDGGQVNFTLTAAPGCRFEITGVPAWLTLSGSTLLQMPDSGNLVVSLTTGPNASGTTRHATLIIGNNVAYVHQVSAPVCLATPTVTLNPTSLPYTGGNGTISVKANDSCPWSVSGLPAWVSPTTSVSGSGNASIGYTAAANNGTARTGAAKLDALGYGVNFTLNQDAIPLCPTAPVLSPASISADYTGSSGTISVTAPASCPWTVGSLPTWMTLTTSKSGTGNGSFGFTIAANSGSGRSTSTSITGPGVSTNLDIRQTGSPCVTWSISPSSISAPAAGSTGSINVSAAPSCNWSLASLPAWMSVTSATSGSGNASLAYSIAANTGASRSVTLSLSGSGPNLWLSVSQSAYVAPCAAPTAISSGVPVNGSLQTTACTTGARGTSYYTDRYSFTSTPGRAVTILLTSSAFDSYVYLRDPSGVVISSNDDGGGGTNSRIPASSGSFTLPAGTGGVYTIEVTSYSTLKTGAYTLSFSQ